MKTFVLFLTFLLFALKSVESVGIRDNDGGVAMNQLLSNHASKPVFNALLQIGSTAKHTSASSTQPSTTSDVASPKEDVAVYRPRFARRVVKTAGSTAAMTELTASSQASIGNADGGISLSWLALGVISAIGLVFGLILGYLVYRYRRNMNIRYSVENGKAFDLDKDVVDDFSYLFDYDTQGILGGTKAAKEAAAAQASLEV